MTAPPPAPEYLYPVGYGTSLATEAEMRRRYEPHMEPEFARRFFAWLRSRCGEIGCGGGRRTVQPEKPGFAPPGMSFHQDQRYCDGTVWYAAVDLVARNPGAVHRAPRPGECPPQGSGDAARWGVHINTSESWHIQPVELDGYQSWIKNGRPRPRSPATRSPVAAARRRPPPTSKGDDDVRLFICPGDPARPAVLLGDGWRKVAKNDEEAAVFENAYGPAIWLDARNYDVMSSIAAQGSDGW